jgi:hypothetical protein
MLGHRAVMKGVDRAYPEVAPEVLTAKAQKGWFEAVIDRLLEESSGEDPPYFYCRPCGEYHLRPHLHHTEMMKRKRANAK